ncbi:MAG: hypothetical protein H6817_02290 [Phycisphaerales bacterium]|nr:hypothetical protein [Phycisphaerales bacterium]
MNDSATRPAATHPRRGPLRALLDLFNSVWFGIILMVLIFLYMTVASAGILHPLDWSKPFGTWTRLVVRQRLGLTEMEAFAWWPFTTLLTLFIINMCVVTIRRIRFNALSAGVWAIHTGIVILAGASVYYFSTKMEGDTPVFRRSIVVEVPGAAPERIIVQPGAATNIQSVAGNYRVAIQSINPTWPLLSGEDAGKTACSVNVQVTTPSQSFIRQMLINYPQYTEDIIPGQGRAIKAVGRKLLDEDLKLSFAYEPQNYFYLQDTAALYVRELGSSVWLERPIEHLPHYSNNIASRNEIWQPEGEPPVEPNPLDIAVPPTTEGDPLADYDVRVTGRLHYVESLESRWVAGGAQLNPFLAVDLEYDSGTTEHVEMLALDSNKNTDKDGLTEFRWVNSAEARQDQVASVGNSLDISIPAENVQVTVPVNEFESFQQNPDAPFLPITGSAWTYRIRGMARNEQIGNAGPVTLAVVEFQNGAENFRRFVFENDGQSHDRTADNEVHKPDPRIVTHFRPGPMILFIGGPTANDLIAVVNTPNNQVSLTTGKPVQLGGGLSLRLKAMFTNARIENRPALTPLRFQDPQAGSQRSRIKVEIGKDGSSNSVWLPYHHYPLPDRQYAGNRFFYAPTTVTLPGGKRVELMYSRKRWPLPSAVTLEDFDLKTHVGGFVQGNTQSVRDFVSLLRSYRDGKWSDVYTTSLNKPASDQGWYYFQATWDPGTMAYTGLGVGNRNGVHAQLVGCCIAVLGMIYVFYVKPIIKRRRRQAVWASVKTQEPAEQREAVATAS